MSDYFDHVERDLRSAVRRHDHLPWYVRLRLRRSRPLVVLIAALLVAGPALAAVSLLQSGSSVGPNVPPTPNAFDGVALRRGIDLLPLRASDPAGGPPWGMRLVRTTRGLVCVQVGRVAFAAVGALGRDGAFGNDGRFHPFSPNYENGPPCSVPDARGNAFINVAEWGVPSSALFAANPGEGCRPPRTLPRDVPAQLRKRIERRRRALRHQHICPIADVRNLYYGLLGPEAISITYVNGSGQRITTPTGPDGSYLIVQRGGMSSNNNGFTYDSGTVGGPLRAIHYRDGHTCHPGRCQPVGYASPRATLPTPAQVASPISVRVERAAVWCAARRPDAVPTPGRCKPPASAAFQQIQGGPPSVLVVFSFISRVAVTNGHSYYYFTINRPPRINPRNGQPVCGGGGFGETLRDYSAGERVVEWSFENLRCPGRARGTVTLVITTGPSAPAPMPAVHGQSVGREVGNFTFTVP